ncbi:MAG: SurA N-terminal domain-containing protein [Myxococcota bacterium]
MRRHSQSFIIYFIFGAIIVVFAFTFGPGGGSCTPGQGQFAALVDGDAIPQQTFGLLYRNRVESYRRSAVVAGMNFSNDMIERMGLRKQVIDQLIDRKLLAHEARRRGLVVSDEDLLDYLEAEYRVKEVTFDQYQNWVGRTFQTSVTAFEDDVRGEILGNKLKKFIDETVSVSEGEVKEQYQREHDRAMLTFVEVDTAEVDVPDPSAGAIDTLITNDADTIKERYDRDILQYRTPQQVSARQILRQLPQDASDADVAKARGFLLELKTQIDGGADFGALAKEHSEDDATKEKGGDMGKLERGQGLEPISKVVFALEKDAISAEPVRTRLGLHLLQVTGIQPPSRKKLEDIQAEVAKKVLLERAREEAARTQAEELLASLQKGGDIEKLTISEAEARDQPTNKKLVRRGTAWVLKSQLAVPRIGQSEELHAEIFALTKEAPVAKKVHKVGRSYYVAILKDREIPDLANFEADKDSLRQTAIWSKRSMLFREWLAHLRKTSNVQYNSQLFPN